MTSHPDLGCLLNLYRLVRSASYVMLMKLRNRFRYEVYLVLRITGGLSIANAPNTCSAFVYEVTSCAAHKVCYKLNPLLIPIPMCQYLTKFPRNNSRLNVFFMTDMLRTQAVSLNLVSIICKI